MRTKWIFIIIVVFITGMLAAGGYLFFRDEPVSFWIIQCMAMASVLFSLFLYRALIRPYDLLLNGIQLLKEQDFTTYLYPVKNKDANQLIDLFNKMITRLRNERLAVREKTNFWIY